MNGITSNGGFDHYRDDFTRDDMRRDDDDRYRRGVRNGGPGFDRFNTDFDQNSLSDFRSNEPKFELDHLATFAAGTRNGVLHAEDGLRKLRQMENTTGIWTMRCILIVERGCLVILDNSSGEELERFPIQLVQDPTAIFKNDRREIYNNLILFTIVDDPKKRSSQADMHIFQSCKAPAQEIVDEILAAKNGQQKLYPPGGSSLVIYQQNTNNYRNYRSRLPVPPPEPPGTAYDFQKMRNYLDTTEMRQFNQTSYSQGGQFGGPISHQRSFITRVNTLREKEDLGGGSTEILERDVQLLNHCFDDIEKFVARLQQAAESYKELEKRKRDRGAKNKKKQSGDGMLNARARPPPDQDFVDIFQKFKLSFNLLAKLKAHIHDPNAPELVHFLFTPLSLIYEASRDPYHGNQNLGDQAVAPVLTGDAKQLLLNCLTSKEIELWQALGKHWTTSRDEWNGHIPPYVPEFYDGWQPAAGVIDELTARSAIMAQQPMIEPMRTQPVIEERPRAYNPVQRPMHYPDEDRFHRNDDFDRFESAPRGYESNQRAFESNPRGGFEPLPSRGFEPLTRGYDPNASRVLEPPGMRGYEPQSRERSPSRSGMGSPYSSEFVDQYQVDRNVRPDIPKMVEREPHRGPMSRQDENAAYYDELRRNGDTQIYEAVHDRPGKNPKELSVQKGDVLQVLDSSKNWWKLRNYKGEVGFAPYTILKQLQGELPDKLGRADHLLDSLQIHNTAGPPSRTTNSEASYQHDLTTAHLGGPAHQELREEASPPAGHDSYLGHPPPLRATAPHLRRKESVPALRYSATMYPPQQTTPREQFSPYPPRGAQTPQAQSTPTQQKRISFSQHQPATNQRAASFKSSSEQVTSFSYPDSPVRFRQQSPTYPQQLRGVSTKQDPPPSYSLSSVQPPHHASSLEEDKYDLDMRQRGRSKDHMSEIHSRVTRGARSSDVIKLTENSRAEDVETWLAQKGFSEVAREALAGYTGWDLFQLRLSDVKRLLSHDEAIRLDGLILLQKNTSGYSTRSAKELNDILEKRKSQMREEDDSRQQIRWHDQDNANVGSWSRHSLRDLLQRQRTQLRPVDDF
ncbi:epidermal growth factor receptor kinase substrate 8-like isoform X3 [Physella acuta]|nr:epidermal growth factor receptor kinase substrate 8-like isoform X3 [Physella acuta]